MRSKYPDIMWIGLDENFNIGNVSVPCSLICSFLAFHIFVHFVPLFLVFEACRNKKKANKLLQSSKWKLVFNLESISWRIGTRKEKIREENWNNCESKGGTSNLPSNKRGHLWQGQNSTGIMWQCQMCWNEAIRNSSCWNEAISTEIMWQCQRCWNEAIRNSSCPSISTLRAQVIIWSLTFNDVSHVHNVTSCVILVIMSCKRICFCTEFVILCLLSCHANR